MNILYTFTSTANNQSIFFRNNNYTILVILKINNLLFKYVKLDVISWQIILRINQFQTDPLTKKAKINNLVILTGQGLTKSTQVQQSLAQVTSQTSLLFISMEYPQHSIDQSKRTFGIFQLQKVIGSKLTRLLLF